MYIGVDLGTSGVKAVLCDDVQEILAQAEAPLSVERPHPLWSEQSPQSWWAAVESVISQLGQAVPDALAQVRGIGLSGQMHGATLLDRNDTILRPAILWNDGRSGAECAALERAEPRTSEITGNRAMPGFTAPKIMWVREHEPDIFAKIAKVLLPKDYIRFLMTSDYVSEMSDAAGTLWLDVGARD